MEQLQQEGRPPDPTSVENARSTGRLPYMSTLNCSKADSGGAAEYFLSNYRIKNTLGFGSSGKVKLAEHVQTGHKVAVKFISRAQTSADKEAESKVRREIEVMLLLSTHPHLVSLLEVIETPSYLYIVMEYLQEGELFTLIQERGRLPEPQARHIFQQIISGVEYCHQKMVVHRDLKPENLLLDSGMAVKLADFGLSNVMRDGHFLKSACGSPQYAAPEVISGRLYSGPEVDLWSCGVILFALLCGTLPFDDDKLNFQKIFAKVLAGAYAPPQHLSSGARDLIRRLLVVDPLKRLTIPEIWQHSWFAQDVPRYLAALRHYDVTAGPHVDAEVLKSVMDMGYDRNDVLYSIKKGIKNKASVAYFLKLKSMQQIPMSAKLLDRGSDVRPGHKASSLYTMGAAFSYEDSDFDCGTPVTPTTPPTPGGVAPLSSANSFANWPQQRDWQLGTRIACHPKAIICDLLRVLHVHSVAWKKCGQYNVKCLYTPKGGPRGAQIRFEVQLYAAGGKTYCLDAQRTQGDLFCFMDVVSSIMNSLRPQDFLDLPLPEAD